MDYEAQRAILVGSLSRRYPHDPPEWIEDAVSEVLHFTTLPVGLTVEQKHSYLFQASRRLLYREHRFHQREPFFDSKKDAMDNSILADRLNAEAREFIEWGLSQLPGRTAKIIRQKRFDKIPLRLVAARLYMKTPTVQKIYLRGMKKLSDILRRELYGGGVIKFSI